MQVRLWAAMMLLGMATGAAGAQTSTQNQAATPNQPAAPVTAPQGTMEGMDVNAGPDQPNARTMEHGRNVLAASPLRIAFAGKSAAWTLAELALLPHTPLTVYNEHVKTSQTYSGVPLMVLLAKVGVPATPHGKATRLYLVAEGADGFEAVYSLAEVNPDVHEGHVIVADAMNGKPLGADGPFKIVAAGDKHPSRWVRNLALVRVEAAR